MVPHRTGLSAQCRPNPMGLPFERLLCIGLDANALQAAVVNKVRSVPNGSFRPLQCATAHGYRCSQCIAASPRALQYTVRSDSDALCATRR
jgi:hypothetical protein